MTPITYFSIADLFTLSIDLSEITVYWEGALWGLGYQHVSTYANLHLSRNRFSGIIRPDLGNLKGLKSLNITCWKEEYQLPWRIYKN
jgi:hypothetical protein